MNGARARAHEELRWCTTPGFWPATPVSSAAFRLRGPAHLRGWRRTPCTTGKTLMCKAVSDERGSVEGQTRWQKSAPQVAAVVRLQPVLVIPLLVGLAAFQQPCVPSPQRNTAVPPVSMLRCWSKQTTLAHSV